MTNSLRLPVMAAALALPLAAGVAAQEAQRTQVSPSATESLPAEGQGQTAVSNAVTGSAPAPGTGAAPGPQQPAVLDNSQAQQGKLLKPGAEADDMDAAAGAEAPSGQPAN
jgi:hypothetical protein